MSAGSLHVWLRAPKSKPRALPPRQAPAMDRWDFSKRFQVAARPPEPPVCLSEDKGAGLQIPSGPLSPGLFGTAGAAAGCWAGSCQRAAKKREPGQGAGCAGTSKRGKKKRKNEVFCSGFKWLGKTMCPKGPGLGFLSAEEPLPWVNASSWAGNPNQGGGKHRESKRVPNSCPAVTAGTSHPCSKGK